MRLGGIGEAVVIARAAKRSSDSEGWIASSLRLAMTGFVVLSDLIPLQDALSPETPVADRANALETHSGATVTHKGRCRVGHPIAGDTQGARQPDSEPSWWRPLAEVVSTGVRRDPFVLSLSRRPVEGLEARSLAKAREDTEGGGDTEAADVDHEAALLVLASVSQLVAGGFVEGWGGYGLDAPSIARRPVVSIRAL